MTACHGVRTLLGADALGLLDGHEARDVRAHLATCPDCTAERARLLEAVALLDLDGAPSPTPSPALEGRVLDGFARERTPRRATRRWWPAAVAAGAVALAALMTAVVLWSGTRPGTREVAYALNGTAGAPGASGRVRVALRPAGTAIRLQVRGLPPSGDGVYEMWFLRDGEAVSAGTFRVGAGGAADVSMSTAADPREYPAMGITLEPDDQDPARNGAPVLRGSLPG